MKTLEKYEKLRRMCREQTRLSEEDIDFLEIMAVAIEQMAKMEEADIYIDCLAKNGLPLVVAEAKSSWALESGQPFWLGHYMEPYNEPAAYQALTAGVRSRGVNSMTENGLQFLQTAEPLQRQGRVVGVLLKEQRILGGDAEPESEKDPAGMEVLLSGIDQGGVSEYIDEGVLLIDAQGKVTSVNKAAQRIYERLGYKPEKLLGESLEKVCLVNFSGEQKNQIEDSYVIETKVGGLDLIIHYFYLGDGRMMILLKDRTRERKRESELVVKSVMINEIHHRIKNNLQMVVSFLNLQKRRSRSEEVRESLETAAARVMSIASTHGMFALKKNDRVSLGELLEVLEENFQESVRLQEKQIELHVTGDKLIIDSETADCLGIILNELLQNCMKYAFEGREKGCIEVSVSRTDGATEIKVQDDGNGFREAQGSNDGLGLKIVKLLAEEKLGAEFSETSDETGTTALLRIPDKR